MPASRRIPNQTALVAVAVASFIGLGLGAGVVSVFVNPGRVASAGEVGQSAGQVNAPGTAADPVGAEPSEAPAPSASEARPVAEGGAPKPAVDAGGEAEAPDEPAAPPPGDLAADEGLLTLEFDGQADVWVHGKKIGPTNQPNKTSCGQRWTRVGRDMKNGAGRPVPEWLSPGLSIVIECGKPTSAELPKNR